MLGIPRCSTRVMIWIIVRRNIRPGLKKRTWHDVHHDLVPRVACKIAFKYTYLLRDKYDNMPTHVDEGDDDEAIVMLAPELTLWAFEQWVTQQVYGLPRGANTVGSVGGGGIEFPPTADEDGLPIASTGVRQEVLTMLKRAWASVYAEAVGKGYRRATTDVRYDACSPPIRRRVDQQRASSHRHGSREGIRDWASPGDWHWSMHPHTLCLCRLASASPPYGRLDHVETMVGATRGGDWVWLSPALWSRVLHRTSSGNARGPCAISRVRYKVH